MLPSQSSAMTSLKPVKMKVEAAQVDQLSHERSWPAKGLISGERRQRRVVMSPKSRLLSHGGVFRGFDGSLFPFSNSRGRKATVAAVESTAAAALPSSKRLGAK